MATASTIQTPCKHSRISLINFSVTQLIIPQPNHVSLISIPTPGSLTDMQQKGANSIQQE